MVFRERVLVRPPIEGGITGDIALSTIDSTNLTNSAVTTAKINNDAVDSTKLANSAVTTAKINDDAVTAAKIDEDVVGPEHINPAAVWGASGKKLLNFVPVPATNPIFRIETTSGTTFSALINGGPAGTSVVYDTVTGNEASIDPNLAYTQDGHLMLHNTTRGESALIYDVNTGTNTITLTNNVPGTWADNDAIQVNSTANTTTSFTNRYFDVDISGMVPTTCHAILLLLNHYDSAGASFLGVHPYEEYNGGKSMTMTVNSSGDTENIVFPMPIISQRFTYRCQPSGAGTARINMKILGYWEEAST